MAYQFVNISLIYVKCLLIESKEEAIKNQSGLVLDKAYNLLIKWFGHQDQYYDNIQNIKDHIYQKNYQKENGMESLMRHEQSAHSRTNIQLPDFLWMLSSIATIAAFFNSIQHQKQCETVYVRYVKLTQDVYGNQSLEASNAYFMIGVYYFEIEHIQKSLGCFIKSLSIRKTKLGPHSIGIADCHYNMAILYKKLGIYPQVKCHYDQAL